MLKTYFLLFYEFSKIGVLAIGGGYAALPFLYYIQSKYDWFSIDELTNMIAVANITPGPVGINMATYTGYTTANLIGAVIATLSIVFLPFIFVLLISKLFNKFKNCNFINGIFLGLRPASCALLSVIAIQLLKNTFIGEGEIQLGAMFANADMKAIFLFILMIIPFSFVKKNPLLIIIAGALGGILIKSF